MTERSSNNELRYAAIRAERESTEHVPLDRIWRELVDGQARVLDSFFTDERCYLVLTPASIAAHGGRLAGRRRTVIEALLCGVAAKVVALDLNLSLSTISQDARAALQHLGLVCTPARVHPLLAMAARAASAAPFTMSGASNTFCHEQRTLRVIGAARPDHRLAPLLPAAEYAVVRGLVEGKNYVEIAQRRGTSTRTVANQLSAVFRRFSVSGRCNLLHLLVSSDRPLAC